jgi:hypothetical protein
MPRQVRSVPIVQGTHAQWLVEAERLARSNVERGRDDHCTVVAHCDEATVEGSVELRGEQEAVPDVEALGVAGAVGPGLDVARAEQLWDGEAGDGAAALPVLEQAVAEEVLADALDDEALGLGGLRQRCGLLLEAVEQLVGQRLAELEGAAQQPVERRDVGDCIFRDNRIANFGLTRSLTSV